MADEPGRLETLRRYNLRDIAPESPFDRITSLVRVVLDVPMAAISLVDEHRQWFKSRDGFDASETTREISFCTHTIAARGPMIVTDARIDPRFNANPLVVGPPNVVSYVGAPLVSRDGYQIGSLCALDRVPRDYSAAEVGLLAKFSALVVDTFELRQIATRDFLTGALSRRAFLDTAAHAIMRHARDGQECALLLFDLDHFKAINDRHGHAAGDVVLEAISACCQTLLRAPDVFGRVGGEEFAVLLPGAGPAAGIAIAERFRVAIANVTVAFDPDLRVTASFGVASLTHAIVTADEWLAGADIALFAAKDSGRNRCLEATATPEAV
ncbi:sensor domain-containing diguanylate cyclase [Polymorphobacter megasporae]|nr:sensor domain-containing diguanylate cyclase [Polymorphobacter sp. PAMC 29334]QYE36990.1 sensor domain-containing diguanylate cyclase [Polymorphobacter sp. PAMC 29334]UAJ12016.1 sensor domain-containing diguanylate cyclase [Polymorphobacter megasporae]